MALHFSALRNHYILRRLLPLRASVFNLLDHIHAVDYSPEDNVLVVQERRWHRCNEELTAVCARA